MTEYYVLAAFTFVLLILLAITGVFGDKKRKEIIKDITDGIRDLNGAKGHKGADGIDAPPGWEKDK